ncbi:MAG: hypothetical protein J6X28_02720 [Bacilli bacterium]|nr:hypothetical protein [Bacilli bacterium]
MKKMLLVVLFTVVSLFMFVPVTAHAATVSDGVLFAATPTVTSTSDLSDLTSDYNQDQTCNSILGDPSDENSVAWLLDKILTYATIVGMVLVVVLSSIDFLKVIAKSDDEAMAKATKKLFMRLLLAGLLFFVPTLTAAILDIFGLTAECSIHQQ